jgi:glutamate synthase domain-containing protein 3
MSGGMAVIRPSPAAMFRPEENAVIGNCALYGATGGKLFVHGLAGDRFAVRNSGAVAVVEGAGLHACEYMTRGTVVVLGKVSCNAGAGMTGGTLFLDRKYADFVNTHYLLPVALQQEDAATLRSLLQEYWENTNSMPAKALLAQWEQTLQNFAAFVPVSVAASRQSRAAAESP